MPKFIYFVQASAESESPTAPPPTKAMFETMNVYTTSLSDANMLLAFDGLKSSTTGARITFPPAQPAAEEQPAPTVQAGPFTPGEGLVAGFWIVRAKDLDEAIAWAKKAPFSKFGGGGKIEVRQIAGDEDKGDALTEEIKEKGRLLREMAEGRVREP